MKGFVCFFAMLFFYTTQAQNTYFVSTSGNNNNNGLSENQAWRTIAYALSDSSPLSGGDTLYIKAGYYTGEKIVIEKQTSSDNHIIIQGYKTTPGDNTNFNFDYGNQLDSLSMPLLDGLDRSSGVAIDINGTKNIIIHNLQITNYEFGIMDHTYTDSLNTELNNIIVKDIGDTTDSYSGKAIEFYASNNKITNCIVINSSAQGIYVEGDYNIIENSKVYCDDSTSVEAATDYYIVVYYGSNNIVQNCYVERVGDLPHVGHGIGMKGDCENNLIKNCTAKNFRGESFYVRHRGSKNNIFDRCVATGVTQETTGLVVRDGASNNLFNNCMIIDCKRGIMFHDTDEDDGAQYCGKNNQFNNCIVINAEAGIDFNDYDLESDVDSNYFNNCIFFSGTTLINVERNNFGNKMYNCIVANYQTLAEEHNGHELSFDFNYTDFYNNGFATPSGIGNLSENPLFADEMNYDFHLIPNSPCIDAGTSQNAPSFDFDGTPRPIGEGYDIGAYEFSNIVDNTDTPQSEIEAFPNPTRSLLFIRNFKINSKYDIYDEKGHIIKSGILNNIIDISALNRGVYFLKTANTTIKIMKVNPY